MSAFGLSEVIKLRPTILVSFLIGSALALPGLDVNGQSQPVGQQEKSGRQLHRFSFSDSRQRTYDGIIESPLADQANGYGILMLGGGLVNGLDWEVPPIFTTTNDWTRDGRDLAHEFVQRGFVVGRWRAIDRDDKKYANDPLTAESPTFPETVEHSRIALSTFQKQTGIPDTHTILCGHSLGARRSMLLLADHPELFAVVSLAGANLVDADHESLAKVMRAGEGAWKRHSTNPAASKNNFLRQFIADRRHSWQRNRERDQFGFETTPSILDRSRTRTLVLAGTLDRRWLAQMYALAGVIRDRHGDRFSIKAFQDLGHQLGREVAGQVEHPKYGVIANARVGPIEPAVVRYVGHWLSNQVESER